MTKWKTQVTSDGRNKVGQSCGGTLKNKRKETVLFKCTVNYRRTFRRWRRVLQEKRALLERKASEMRIFTDNTWNAEGPESRTGSQDERTGGSTKAYLPSVKDLERAQREKLETRSAPSAEANWHRFERIGEVENPGPQAQDQSPTRAW